MTPTKQKILDGLEALRAITERIADHEIAKRSAAGFTASASARTGSVSHPVRGDAEADAAAFAEARNRGGGAIPHDVDDAGIVDQVTEWLTRTRGRLRGSQKH